MFGLDLFSSMTISSFSAIEKCTKGRDSLEGQRLANSLESLVSMVAAWWVFLSLK
jgi:hypothetical protein